VPPPTPRPSPIDLSEPRPMTRLYRRSRPRSHLPIFQNLCSLRTLPVR
jgi:hypothetical protein